MEAESIMALGYLIIVVSGLIGCLIYINMDYYVRPRYKSPFKPGGYYGK